MYYYYYICVRVSLIYRFYTSFTVNYFKKKIIISSIVYSNLIYLARQWPQHNSIEPCSKISQQIRTVDTYHTQTHTNKHRDIYRIHMYIAQLLLLFFSLCQMIPCFSPFSFSTISNNSFQSFQAVNRTYHL